MDRDEVVARPEFLLVNLRLDFRHAEPDQATDDPAGRGSQRGTAERGHDWSRRDERPDAGDGERTETREQSDDAPAIPPVMPPAAVPSGALLDLTWPMSWSESVSGISTEISE